jgi:hypothetical protein
MAKTRFRMNKKGEKVSIELTVKEYEKLVDDLDELDAIRAYDEAKGSGEQMNAIVIHSRILSKDGPFAWRSTQLRGEFPIGRRSFPTRRRF